MDAGRHVQNGFRYIIYDKANEDMLSIPKAELLGKNDFEIWPKDIAEFIRDKDLDIIEKGEKLEIPKETLNTKDHGRIYVHTIKVPVPDETGKIRYLFGITEDISERVIAQRMLEEQRTRTVYSAKMATLGEMAGGVAHEINTPLAIIKIKTEQLLEMVSEGTVSQEMLQKSLGLIDDTLGRISNVVRGLKSFSRNGSRDSFQPVKVSAAIKVVLGLCSERFRNRGIRLEVEGIDTDLTINERETEVAQVILNLLSNSYDAIQNYEDKWIKIKVADLGSVAEIRIIDCGPGIPADVRARMFEPFFTTKGLGMGTGLGLGISFGIVEKHGGRLFYDENCPNTCFVIWLPKV